MSKKNRNQSNPLAAPVEETPIVNNEQINADASTDNVSETAEMVYHEVNADDIAANPELTEEEIKEGDVVNLTPIQFDSSKSNPVIWVNNTAQKIDVMLDKQYTFLPGQQIAFPPDVEFPANTRLERL